MKITFIEGEFSDRSRALCYEYIKQMYLRMMQNIRHESDEILIEPISEDVYEIKIEVKPDDNGCDQEV